SNPLSPMNKPLALQGVFSSVNAIEVIAVWVFQILLWRKSETPITTEGSEITTEGFAARAA
ncbi:MAG: hypothetical protein QGI78_03070, partial [Phycisphaerales bacterium]|nr:hypothetical protein [Phycisphaerales bacterium]